MKIHSFEKEITILKADVLKMLSLVSESLNMAVRSLEEMDEYKAQRVLDLDDAIDDVNREVEKKVYQILERYNPLSKDLCYTITMIKFANNLERIGDLACNIAEKTILVLEKKLIFSMPKEMKDMFGITLKMVHDSFKAFSIHNIEMAIDIWKRDSEIDELEKEINGFVVSSIREENIDPELATVYILIARDLERIADHATNLCEEIVYIETGKELAEFLKT